MSKVYIEGIKMPKCCNDCPLAVLDEGKVYCIVHCQQVCWTDEKRDPHCPLREVNDDKTK